jgi:hypothetical protein
MTKKRAPTNAYVINAAGQGRRIVRNRRPRAQLVRAQEPQLLPIYVGALMADKSERIDLMAVAQHFEMHMGAGGAAA